MNKDEKQLIIKIKEIMNIILEDHNNYVIDSLTMNKLNNYFYLNSNLFNENFIRNYISFIEIFNCFFDYLLSKILSYEDELLNNNTFISNSFFIFDFNDFKDKKGLTKYQEILYYLENMFHDDSLLQGIILYMHINELLYKLNFCHNKIKLNNNIPTIAIDYGYRLDYYKEEYITIFRHELEEGIRNSVFIENEEIVNYIKQELKRVSIT